MNSYNDIFEKYSYDVLRTFALTHNYNLWIIKIFSPYIGRKVLEVGSGIGNLTWYLKKYDLDVLVGIDKNEKYIQHLKIDFPYVKFYAVDVTDDKILDLFGYKSFDTIFCVNVLEHIQDDMSALSNMYELLMENGRLLLFVPALKCLYGSLDVHLEHFRRYNKKELIEKLNIAGFEIEVIKYSNLLGALGWFLNAKILKRRRFSILQPLIFDKIIPVISKIEGNFSLPLGMSLIVVCRKAK